MERRFISGDIVANLQGQIDELREEVENLNERIDFILSDMALVKLTLRAEDGTLLHGVLIENFKTLQGESVAKFSDKNGYVEGYIPSGNDYDISVSSKMLDIVSKTITISKPVAGTSVEKEETLTPRDYISVDSSGTYYESNYYSSGEFSLVGGGGGGASGGMYWKMISNTKTGMCVGGGGGGGGEVAYGSFSPIPKEPLKLEIGTGGAYGTATTPGTSDSMMPSLDISGYARKYGLAGGSSTFRNVVASGGGGGGASAESTNRLTDLTSRGESENGPGGVGLHSASGSTGGKGQDGTKYFYTGKETQTLCGGGGGGGGNTAYTETDGIYTPIFSEGGSPYGGRGGGGVSSPIYSDGPKFQGQSGGNKGGGGGGAGGVFFHRSGRFENGGKGGNGACGIRYFK